MRTLSRSSRTAALVTAAIAGSTAAMLLSSTALAAGNVVSYLVVTEDSSNTSTATFTPTDTSTDPYTGAAATFDLLKVDGSLNPAPDGALTVSVSLDSFCANALETGLHYAITATSADPTIATVSPAQSDKLRCPSDTSGNPHNLLPSSATFTVTPVGCGIDLNNDPEDGITSILFSPVTETPGGTTPPGQQKKVGDATLDVTVLNDCGGGGTGTGTGDRPAAPAVTNAYLNAGRGGTLWNDCKTVYAKKYGKKEVNWRGGLINEIAAWMPLPESLKDDISYFPSDNDWIDYVKSEVRHKCSKGAIDATTIAPDWDPQNDDEGGAVPAWPTFWVNDGGLAPNYT